MGKPSPAPFKSPRFRYSGGMRIRLFAAFVAAVFVMSLTAAVPNLAELNKMIARFAPVELKVDTSKLSPGDQQALKKLIEAAKVIDEIFLQQRWYEIPAVRVRLETDKSALGKARLHYFDINKGPWSELDGQTAFLPNVLQGSHSARGSIRRI